MLAAKLLTSKRALILAVTCIAAALLNFASAIAEAPALSHLFPPGGQRGSKVEVTCAGKFTWPVQVWAPGVDVVVGKDTGKLEVAIPEDLAADRVWIRLYNAEGISAAVPFLIGSLKETGEQEPNNSPQHAQPIAEAAVTINGALKENADVDTFAVTLAAGQTLVAALDANSRLGSPMDAVLQVTSSDGTVLAENHDEVGLDPRLAYTAKSSGTHLVRLFAFPSNPDATIAFRGSADYIYRLTLTTGPYITHAIPLAAPQSDPGTVEVRGWNIPPKTKLAVRSLQATERQGGRILQEIEMPGDLRNSPESRLGIAWAPQYAGVARIRLLPHAVQAELAQNDADHPLVLAAPTSVTGWLRQPKQTDYYRIPLKKGQPAVIAVEAHSLDLPLYPLVKLIDPTGKVVTTVDNAGPEQDAVLTHAAAQDGDYRLTVSQRIRQTSERAYYRLTVRIEEPDFELSAGADAIVVAPGKPTEMAITVQRRAAPGGAVGPITVEAVDLPAGVTAAPVVSEASGATAGKVTLVFNTTGAAFSGPIRVSGTATQPREIKRMARTPAKFGVGFDMIWLTGVAK